MKQLIEIVQKETRVAALFLHIIAQHMNIQFSDIRCLNHLVEHPSATAGEIAEVTGLTTGAVTAMIDRLEKANLVERKSDNWDRRKIIIMLKSDNFNKSNIANKFFANDVKKLLSTYPKNEQKIISQWNEDMTRLLQEKTNALTDSR